MTDKITLDKLEGNLEFFNKMYDMVRIVDPVRKEVVEWKGSEMSNTDEICYKYWQSGEICDNCISVRAYNENKSFFKLEQNPTSTMLVTAIPIENADKPTVLELLKNATDNMFVGTGDYTKGHMICRMVSEINDMVIRDSLTNLYNRRFIDERLSVDIVKATIEESPLSIIFMDMDNLKEINDTYGHEGGDLALKEISKVINRNIRTSNDWAARYGGDEFIIALNNTNSKEAYSIAKRIRYNLEEVFIPIENRECIYLSVSMGIHTLYKNNLTANELIRKADQNMYEAKKTGKNHIVGCE